jgi:hypothetical protein
VAAIEFVEHKQNLLMAPVYAMPKMLAKAGLTLQDFDFYEIHEAFAAQVLTVLKIWEDEELSMREFGVHALGKIDPAKLNVTGSSLAAGHPFAATGGRNKQEMQNTSAITKGASEYLTQLDALAEITGKSREEQEKALKEASANAAYESYLQGLDEEGKKKATLAMQNALATGGKAGADVLKSQLLGLPPMTEAAQKLTALGPNVANGIKQMGDAVNDSGKSMKDVEKGRAAAQAGATKDVERLGKSTLAAMSFMSGPDAQMASSLQKTDNINKQQGIRTAEDAEKQMQSVKEQQKKRMESEAADAAKTQKSMQELGQTIMSALLPVIKILTPVVNFLAQGLSAVAKQFERLPGILQLVIAGGLAYLAFRKVKEAREAAGGVLGGASGLGGLGRGPLGSAGNPMHVIIAGGSAGGGLGDLGSKGGKGKLGKLGGLGKGVLKGAGVAGGIASALMLAGDLSDIEAQKKAGTISEAEATKAKGGAVGEAGGGLAGGLAGAAAGAALGSVVPILGTAIGGLIGGAIGAYGGGGLGKSAGEFLAGGSKKAADGALVSNATNITAGEAGPEIISPIKYFNNLQSELETLNKQTMEMIRYMKETAEYTRRTHDATKSLGGDLFKF